MAWTKKVVATRMPKGQSQIHKTGAQSQALFKQTFVYKRLQKQIEKTYADLNQKEKSDAQFNLGLKS